jgi:Uma2 family endonuclease
VRKRPHYQRNQVPEYWIVDDTSETIERWTPDEDRPEILAERVVWHPAGAPDPFVLDLVTFFKDVAAED